MPNKVSHDDFVNRVREINSKITVIGEYTKAQKKNQFECKICKHQWYATPNNILNGRGCPKCAKRIKITNDIFKDRVYALNPSLDIISDFKSKRDRVLVRCNTCGYIWEPIAESLLIGCGCPKCADVVRAQKRCKSHKEFLAELYTVNASIQAISNYHGRHNLMKFKCSKCGYTWEAQPHNVLHGTGCPVCSSSKGERTVAFALDALHIDYIPQYKFVECKSKRLLSFDFYLPEYNSCIEYDGIQHFKPIKHFGGENSLSVTTIHDDIKNKYCLENGINLLRIPYTETGISNIEPLLLSFISMNGGDAGE